MECQQYSHFYIQYFNCDISCHFQGQLLEAIPAKQSKIGLEKVKHKKLVHQNMENKSGHYLKKKVNFDRYKVKKIQ